jgi:PKHD-type hydroxylase
MDKVYSFEQNKSRVNANYTNYYWFNDAFSLDELKKIELLTNDIPYQYGGVGELNSARLESNYRSSKIKWCPQTQNWEWVYDKLAAMIKEANEMLWGFDLYHMRELIQYTEYNGNGSQYDWHMDCGLGIQNQRKVSVTVQLSSPDDYEGGDLEFNLGQILRAPKLQGCAVIFPSFFLHRVTPVTKGTRKSFVLWVGGEPYK